MVAASLREQDGDVYLQRHCRDHAGGATLYWKNARLFRRIDAVAGSRDASRPPECALGQPCQRHLAEDRTAQIMIDLTGACNFNCPICFADANQPGAPAMTPEEILQRLPPASRWRRPPHVVFIGGEPTLHPDLPRLVREVRARGFVPRLATNGKRLEDPDYLDALVAAGLGWVVLQFDGLDEAVDRRLRGQPLFERKHRLIAALRARGVKVQFAVMCVQGVNTGNLGAIVDYAFDHEVFWVSLYPYTEQNRCRGDFVETHVSDVLAALDAQTGGRITADDFVQTMRLWSWLYRATGNRVFKQKRTTLPMVLIRDGGEIFPISRLLRPGTLARHPRVPLRLLRDLQRILEFEQRDTPEYLRYLVIKKFHAEAALDLVEAAGCHMAYMTRDSFVPFDIYHILARKTG